MPTSMRSNYLALAVIASVFGASLAFAQSTPPSTTAAPKHESARERRKALEEESAQKQRRREEWDKQTLEAVEARDRKRTDCRMHAKERNLHLMKRVRFIRKCMASGSPR